MKPPANSGPREFGEALRRSREAAGVSLDLLAERTKISKRALAAFESGTFNQLPSGAFPRLFLRQVVELLGEDPRAWIEAFEEARGIDDGDRRPAELVAVEPVRRARMGPWVWGLLLVSGALVTVVLVERRQAARTAVAAPTPATVLMVAPPTTPTPAVTPAADGEPTSDANTLVVKAGVRSCWVQVRVGEDAPVSRLLAAGTRWEIPAGGREVNLTLGDGGSVELEYLGEQHRQLGRDGEVVHLRLVAPPATTPER